MAQNDKELVLVTGATGFLAGHVVQCAVNAGYRVRGTVRSLKDPSKVEHLKNMGDVELVEADLLKDGWEQVVAGVDYILHTASPFIVDGTEEQLVAPAVEGTRRVLEAACAEPNVKRIVVTSSVAAISRDSSKPDGYVFTPNDWSVLEDCTPYTKSKTLAEKKAWEIAELDDCKFELCTVNPVFILGPLLNAKDCQSAEVVRNIMMGNFPALPNVPFGLIDVRDCAEVHVRLIKAEGADGGRFITCAKMSYMDEWGAILGPKFVPEGYRVTTARAPDWFLKLYANVNSQAATTVPNLGKKLDYDCSNTKQVTGIEFRDPDQAFIDMAQSQIDFGMITKPEGSRCIIL